MAVISGEPAYGRSKPVLVAIVVAVNVVVFYITTGGTFLRTLDYYFVRYGFKPVYLVSDPVLAVKTLFTSMFIHADIFHLFFNMLFLWVFGSRVEKLVGHGRFIALYVLSGASAVVFHTAFTPFTGLEALGIPAVGASGAISGVLGAYLLLLPRTKLVMCTFFLLLPLCFRLPAYVFLVFWFIQQVVYGYMVLGGVAYFAHVGGFVMGLVLTPLLARPLTRRPPPIGEPLLRYMEEVLGVIMPRRQGLSPVAKAILVLLLLVVAVGFVYNYYEVTESQAQLYVASVNVTDGLVIQQEAVTFSIVGGNLVFSPISMDNVRILVNRIDVILYNPEYANEALELNVVYTKEVSGVIVPVSLNATITYDSHGFVKHSTGTMRSNVVNVYIQGRRVVGELGRPIELRYELVTTRADLDLLASLCLASAAISLLAIPSTVLFKGIKLYEQWTPLLPVV